jgi:hypothetical protein
MFDLRQERLDEIYEAERQFDDYVKPRQEQPRSIVQPGFQLPISIWMSMIGCYAIFLGAMAALVAGSGFALFMVAISILYVVVFFTGSAILANLSGVRGLSPLDRGESLQTWCGPMSRSSVYGQVLIVPAGVAFFGVAVALIGAATS